MAVKLNLLPPELAVSKSLGTSLKTIRMVGVILLAVFIIFVIGLTAVFIISSITLKNLTGDVTTLKSQITAQQVSEQRLVLLKDRLRKISTARTAASALSNLTKIDPFLATLSSDTSVSELNVDPQKIDLTLNFRSNNDLTAFLNDVSDSGSFKNVVISSFGLNPVSGYLVGMSLTVK